MRNFFKILLIGVFGVSLAFAEVVVPPYENFVTDTSGIISDIAESELNERLKAYEAETGTEIAILTIPLILNGLSANEYATIVGNTWGVGKAKVDNGALLLIETDDVPGQHDIYIATGSQLEGGLTDIESRDIVENVIIPQFQNGDFDTGVANGITAMFSALKGESFTDLRMGANSSLDAGGWFQLVLMLIFFVVPWFGAVLGRSEAIWPGGALGAVSGGVLGGVAIGGLFGVITLAVILGIIGLAFDSAVSSNYKSAKKKGGRPSWWAGGGGTGRSSGGGFGGFGGGGFSGGGGGGKW